MGVSVAAHGVHLGVRASDAGTLASALDRLPVGWTYSSSPGVERLWSLIAGDEERRRGTRRLSLLYADAELAARSSRLEDVLEAFRDDAQLFVAERARRRLFVHAAAVGWHGSAILLPGPSGSGKTTLAAELVRAGADYYSDDFALLDRRGRVHPFPRPLAFRRGRGSPTLRVRAEQLGGSAGREPLPVGLVLLTEYRQGASWSQEALSPGQAVLGLLANTVGAKRDPSRALATHERVARHALALQGVRGEAGEAAARIVQIAERRVVRSGGGGYPRRDPAARTGDD